MKLVKLQNEKIPPIALGTWSWGTVASCGDAVFGNHLTAADLKAVFDAAEERENNIRSTIISPGLVDKELYTTVNYPENRELLKKNAKIEGLGLKPADVADAVAYAINTPESVSVSEILIRPTKQIRKWM